MVQSVRKDDGAAEGDESLTRTVIVRPGEGGASQPDDRAHYLVVVEGEERGKRIEIGGDGIVFGRAKPADIVLPDTQVSRTHCKAGLTMGELFVTDLDSSNGTFVAGRRISGSSLVAPGERIAIGGHVLEHEWRSRREVQAARAIDTDLDKAKAYVRSLLPDPIAEGPVRTDWVLQPSAKLGGDMFGYQRLADGAFAIYLLDVTGHGTNAAMHAVSVMNVLRQPTLPGADLRDPAQVAGYLNQAFQMDRHGGMLLSLWYGVFDPATRALAYTAAGHHASYLVSPDGRDARPLHVDNVLIGMMSDYPYRTGRADVPPGSALHLFSDGAFEIEAADGGAWGLDYFVPLLSAPREPGRSHSQRILESVKARTGRQAFEDDFTLVVATFL